MRGKRKYLSTETSADVREFIARLAKPLRKRGMDRRSYRGALAEAGVAVPKSSLDRWLAHLDDNNSVYTVAKASGATPLLDEMEREIAAGWVLVQFDEHKIVSVASFRDFCKASMHVDLSHGSAVNYLHEAGFSSKITQSKTAGYCIDAGTLAKTAFEWAEARRCTGELDGLIASVDFTYTGHRTYRRTSYAPSGGSQPKTSTAIPQHTNCIVTVVWSDGVNRTPPVLFTYNGKFRLDRVRRATWVAEKKWLTKCLDRHKIDRSRVIYIGDEKNEHRLYADESSALLRMFFGLYEIPDDVVVFSDNGKAFFPGGASVLEELGFARHVAYPAAVHQYLSPNDNRLHGTAKSTWRTSGVDFKDDVASSTLLLNRLDADISTHGSHWFRRNITELTQDSAFDLISGRSGKGAKVDQDRRYAYRVFAGLSKHAWSGKGRKT
jgi:hypothetical protein